MPAKVKLDKNTNNEFIQFKTANHTQSDNMVNYTAKVIKKVMTESIAFTGVDITTALRSPRGIYQLYDRCYFSNSEGDVFYWIGADTENWRGWSLRIVKLSDKAAQLAIASDTIKFVITG